MGLEETDDSGLHGYVVAQAYHNLADDAVPGSRESRAVWLSIQMRRRRSVADADRETGGSAELSIHLTSRMAGEGWSDR